jgi:hypothetical protein
MCGKVNFTNLSRYSSLSERTYRRHYDEPFAFMSINQYLISQAIEPARFQVGAIDCSFVPKSVKQPTVLIAFTTAKLAVSYNYFWCTIVNPKNWTGS